jgi:hypothetical protein
MQAGRDIGKLILMAVVFGVCFAMLASVVGVRSPWLGLLLMFYFMGLAQAAEPLFTLRMPRAIRAVDPGLLHHAFYNRLGVHGFGDLLRNTPLRYLNSAVYRTNGKRDLAGLRCRLESSEAIHFWAAVLFTPYIVYIGTRGLIAQTILFVVVQVVFNIYPIMHLRLVRARLSCLKPTVR